MFVKLKKELKPLLAFRRILKAVWLYGSSVYSNNPNDLDVLIVLDDSKDIGKIDLLRLDAVINELSGKKVKKGSKEADIHVQSPKLLSSFWHLLISGEPWVYTSLKYVKPIYDPSNFVRELNKFVGKNIVYGSGEKSEKFLQRSEDYLLKNKDLFVDAISNLKEIGVEAAQILLMFDNKMFFDPKKIISYLEKNYSDKLGYTLGTLKEIVDLDNKADKGYLSVFTGENIQYYNNELRVFVDKVQEVIKSRANGKQ